MNNQPTTTLETIENINRHLPIIIDSVCRRHPFELEGAAYVKIMSIANPLINHLVIAPLEPEFVYDQETYDQCNQLPFEFLACMYNRSNAIVSSTQLGTRHNSSAACVHQNAVIVSCAGLHSANHEALLNEMVASLLAHALGYLPAHDMIKLWDTTNNPYRID